MSNKIGRIVEQIRETKDTKFYKVETLTTDLLTVVDTLTCAAISTAPADGDLVVLVEVQGKLFITGSGGGDMNTLGQVTSVADDGQLTVALYEDGSTNPLTATTHDRKASTQSVTAFQEAYGAADLKVNAWVKCYQLQDVWYVNNLDWTTAASEDLGAGAEVDFIVDNFDRADANDLGTYWDTLAGLFQLQGGKAIPIPTNAGVSSITSAATGSLSSETQTDQIVATLPESTTLRYLSPFDKATKVSLKATVGISTDRKHAAFGLSYNGSKDAAGLPIGDVTLMSYHNIEPFSLSSSAEATLDWEYHVYQYTLTGCDGTDPIWSIPTGTSLAGTLTANFVSITYNHTGGMFAGFKTVSTSGETYVPAYDLNLGVDQDSNVSSDTHDVTYTSDKLSTTVVSGVVLIDTNFSAYCGNPYTWLSSVRMYAKAHATASYTGYHARLANKLGEPRATVEVLVVVTTLQAQVYLDGVLGHTSVLGTIEPFGSVGMIALLNDVGLAGGGVSQFKAWVGDVEPDGSESGHGAINGGVLEYKDGYHSTDTEGVVTYDPLALD